MILKIWQIIKQGVLRFIAELLVRTGFMPVVLFIADRWTFKNKSNGPNPFTFVKKTNGFHYQVLLYHRVNDEKNPISATIPVKVFRKQMEVLSRYFTVLPLEELVDRALRRDIPPKAIAITFDDGYRDNYENAFPILKQFRLPATIFLATGAIDSNTPIWHDLVFDVFRKTKLDFVPFGGRDYPLRTSIERQIAVNAYRRYLRNFNFHDWDNLIRQLIAKLELGEEKNCFGCEKLTWLEIEEMAKDKITFGAHTVTHPILTNLVLSDAMKEIMTSKEAIERKLKSHVKLFAYPNGSREDFNDEIKQGVKDAGFLSALTTIWGSNHPCTDPFELRRFGIWDRNPEIFAVRLGWYRCSS